MHSTKSTNFLLIYYSFIIWQNGLQARWNGFVSGIWHAGHSLGDPWIKVRVKVKGYCFRLSLGFSVEQLSVEGLGLGFTVSLQGYKKLIATLILDSDKQLANKTWLHNSQRSATSLHYDVLVFSRQKQDTVVWYYQKIFARHFFLLS